MKNDSLLWVQGLPIIVTETSIVPRPENPGLVSLSLAFQNLHGAALAYAILPETEIGMHEAPYSARFSLLHLSFQNAPV